MRYCKLDTDGKILNVIEVAETDCQDADGNFDNNIGVEFLENLTGWSSWVPVLEDSVGTAQINGTWDDTNKVFVSIKRFPSWTFNNSTGKWDPPKPKPESDDEINKPYIWNESSQTWYQK